MFAGMDEFCIIIDLWGLTFFKEQLEDLIAKLFSQTLM